MPRFGCHALLSCFVTVQGEQGLCFSVHVSMWQHAIDHIMYGDILSLHQGRRQTDAAVTWAIGQAVAKAGDHLNCSAAVSPGLMVPDGPSTSASLALYQSSPWGGGDDESTGTVPDLLFCPWSHRGRWTLIIICNAGTLQVSAAWYSGLTVLTARDHAGGAFVHVLPCPPRIAI